MTQPPSASKPPRHKPFDAHRWLKILCGVGIGTIILGILAAILLPTRSACGCGSESKSNVGMLMRAQQAYYLENDQFAESIEDLDATVNPLRFKFATVPSDLNKVAIATAIPDLSMPRSETRKSVTGFNYLVDAEQKKIVTGYCQSNSPSQIPPAVPKFPKSPDAEVVCPPDSEGEINTVQIGNSEHYHYDQD